MKTYLNSGKIDWELVLSILVPILIVASVIALVMGANSLDVVCFGR